VNRSSSLTVPQDLMRESILHVQNIMQRSGTLDLTSLFLSWYAKSNIILPAEETWQVKMEVLVMQKVAEAEPQNDSQTAVGIEDVFHIS
jgi:hypothetical protein